jgi:hypothetical protein
VEVEKPRNQWCKFCEIGKGCGIYPDRPQVCKLFNCQWLLGDFPDEMRPDKIGFYVLIEGSVAKVIVDMDREWQGDEIIEKLRQRAHVFILAGNTVTFVPSAVLPAPEKILLDWVL